MICFKFATRSRPNLFDRGISSILTNIETNNYFILVTCDLDDNSMQGVPIKYANNKNIKFVYGHSKNKIDAINRDLSLLPENWNVLINMSDDMVFTQKGFDNIIMNDFNSDFDLCLHYPDGYRKDLITMSIIGKYFFDRFGYIYHPNYTSLWCDNEQTEVSKILGKYRFFNKEIFIHKHPANDNSVVIDEQYKRTESFYNIDKAIYEFRKQVNFGL
jgi:hypothetical protein